MTDTVLYIDDQHALPARVDEILRQAGFVLVHAADPRDALRIVREAPPALVLIEVLLADHDGFALITKLRGAAGTAPMPIVVLTRGERTPRLYGQALELGVADFLCKPVVAAEILGAVLAFAPKDGAGGGGGAAGEKAKPADTSPPKTEFFEGRLEDQPLPQLLGRLHRAGASGVLAFDLGSTTRAVQLRNGSPIAVARHRDVESVADYLRRTRRIDDDQYAMLVDQLMAKIAGPREILLGMEALSGAELTAASHEQARGVLLEIFGWASGRFTFDPEKRLDAAGTLEFVCDPAKIIRAGLKRTPNQVIRAALDRHADHYVATAETTRSQLADQGLTHPERSVVESLVGERTVAEVLTSGSLNERTLYGLYATGIVLLDEIVELTLDHELKLEATVESAAAVTLPRQAFRTGGLPEQKVVGRPTPIPGAISGTISETRESMIDEIARRVDARDDLELFGIAERSRDVDVRAAYDRLLARLDLDDDANADEEMRTRTRALRARLDQAYQRVRTADLRHAFAGIRARKQADRKERENGSRAVDAESWFRTGEGFLGHENYEQAVEAFGMAMHFDPDQGEYSAYLGYALYRSQPGNSIVQREALEHVAKAVKFAPDREMPLLFLSRIFRESGDAASAAKVLRRALNAHPDSSALIEEMCLVNAAAAEPKSKKLIDRFRRR